MKNVPHRLTYVSTCSPVGGTVWEAMELQEMEPGWEKPITQGGALGVYRLTPVQLTLCFLGVGVEA